MELIKVGICLDDVHFAHALAKGLARECRNMVFVLLSEINEGKDCNLILSCEESDDQRVILMVRDTGEENIYDDPPYRVYRYKESHRLANDLLFIYFKLTGKNLELIGDAKCRILVFAAASGGCGCTALAVSVGQMLYKLYGCKCLYLNLCPVDDSKKYLSAEGGKSLLTLLYYLDSQKDFPIGSFISHTHNMDYMNTNVINSYFDEIHQNLLSRLLKKIDQLGEYTFLIVDMSNHMSRTNKQLLRHAARIILLYRLQDQLSEPFFSKLTGEVERLAQKSEVTRVKVFAETDFTEESPSPSITWEKEPFPVNEEGLIDLSRMDLFQLEAGAIAKKIMEEGLG